MSHFICSLCGKQSSILHYDPTNFVDDILIIQKRGLGKGKGFDEVERYSLLDGSDPELLDLISDRVAVIYDMLNVEPDEAEEGDEETEYDEEEEAQPMSPLDREILESERQLKIWEEEENEEDEEEDEDINDLDEEVIE